VSVAIDAGDHGLLAGQPDRHYGDGGHLLGDAGLLGVDRSDEAARLLSLNPSK
jgi:hypothetical protein